jgi:hypothetical protein
VSSSGDPYEEVLVNLSRTQAETLQSSRTTGSRRNSHTAPASQAATPAGEGPGPRWSAVPSLYKLCIGAVASNIQLFTSQPAAATSSRPADSATPVSMYTDTSFDDSMDNAETGIGEGIPDDTLNAILYNVLATQDLTYEIIDSLSFPYTGRLVVPDCSKINEICLSELINKVSTSLSGHFKLNVLRLHHVGTCFTDKVAKTFMALMRGEHAASSSIITRSSKMSNLQLTGLYKLKDDTLSELLTLNKDTLISIDLSNCHVATFGPLTCQAICEILRQPNSALQELVLNHTVGLGDGEKSIHSVDVRSFVTGLGSPRLSVLSLEGCPLLTDNCVDTLLAALGTELSSLNISNCPFLTDGSIFAISKHCRRLSSLNIANLVDISTEALMQLFGANPLPDAESNTVLQVSNSSRLPSSLTANAENHIGVLNYLNVSGLFNVTDYVIYYALQKPASLTYTQQAGEGLRHVNVSKCSKLTGKSAIALAVHCKYSLSQLDMNFTRGFSELSLGYLLAECPFLSKLNIFGCTQLSQEWVSRMAHTHGLSFTGMFMK